MALSISFREAFNSLTGKPPFPWQRALFERFVADRGDGIPSACDLPTGLGKTSVIAIWLIALATRAEQLPRRLVYVVNRRTVVDQTTDEVVSWANNLAAAGLAEPLRMLAAFEAESPLAISTLRGQLADNREWAIDPARPAVIIGTVDMIGSRLLFGGYGTGFKSKPLHAGFLGQDALLVHDEAHLEPAFQELIEAICSEQARCGDGRPLRVMALSATNREHQETQAPFGLSDDDRRHEIVNRRIHAQKRLVLHAIEDEKKLADHIARRALEYKDSKQAILVFLRSVKDVEKVAAAIGKAKCRVAQLTGTLRGYERDRMASDKEGVFARFLPDGQRGNETCYLVCTSAGEVGVNISADHLVCDLTTFESMAQRLGRVNRFGAGEAQVDVFYPTTFDDKDALAPAREKTLDLLRRLPAAGDGRDSSPAALGALPAELRSAAFSPLPVLVPTSDILFDAWSLTSVRDRMPGRPPVADWLHGIAEWQPPETQVAWRLEVERLHEALADEELAELLDEYPLKPHELLRDQTARVFSHLANLAERWPDKVAWVIDAGGVLSSMPFSELAKKDRQNKPVVDFENGTVVLPPSAGGLAEGLLSGESEFKPGVPYDVADKWYADKDQTQHRRRRTWSNANQSKPTELVEMRQVRQLDSNPEADPLPEGEDAPLYADTATGQERFWRWYTRPGSADDDGSKSGRCDIEWDDHTNDVVERAESIVDKLPLPEPVRQSIRCAAQWHDLGKKRRKWQRSIGNDNADRWLAKSSKRSLEISKYRHEFGSLVDVLAEEGLPEFQSLDADQRDLVLHLIAAHHGRGRPHFTVDEAFDPEPKGVDLAALLAEAPRRFARLQRKYGRWGLAYLESLLRAADYAASANPSRTDQVDERSRS